MNQPAETTLFCTEGSSDKEYRVQLVAEGEGWMVRYQNGRRGGTLAQGVKTTTPVAFEVAKKAYDKVVREKLAKGYTPDVSGQLYQATDRQDAFTGHVPQLLEPMRDPKGVQSWINDPGTVGQEKHDGERRMMERRAQEPVLGSNRNGLAVGLPLNLVDAMATVPATQALIDGEIMGERFVAFDLLELNGEDLRAQPYEVRLSRLEDLLKDVPRSTGLETVVTARTAAEKQDLLDRTREAKGEGVVYKKRNAPHAAGHQPSDPSQIKVKFIETATVRVSKASDTKRSVTIEALDDAGNAVVMGKVTIPPNAAVPAAGDLIEVEYLYLFPNGGKLFQPVFQRPRSDLSEPDALSSFKLKASTDAEPAPSTVAPKTARRPSP